MHTTSYIPLFSPRLAESMNVEHRGPFSPSFTSCTLLMTLLYIANLSSFYLPSSIPCINPAELCTIHMLFSPKEKLQTIPTWLSGGAHKGISQWVLTGALLFISHSWAFMLPRMSWFIVGIPTSALCVHGVATSKCILKTGESGLGVRVVLSICI